MAVPFDAELYNIADRSRLRLKIKYPDQRTQISLPRPAHIKPLILDNLGSNQFEILKSCSNQICFRIRRSE